MNNLIDRQAERSSSQSHENDAISRQAALDALNHELRCGAVINQCGLEMAYEVVEGLPSAQPEPRSFSCGQENDAISRQWLMECVNEGWIKFDTEKDANTYIHLVRDIAPSTQPDVIRCKDCKYYISGSDGVRYCFNHDDDILWQDDDFCSRAERKDGETDG